MPTVTFRLPTDLYDRLMDACAGEEMSISDIARQGVEYILMTMGYVVQPQLGHHGPKDRDKV